MEKLTTAKFVNRSKKVHNCRFTYEKTEYKNAKTKVIITCPIHNYFEQTPDNHISKKQGCPKCVGRLKSNEEYIKEVKIVHKNIYDYSKTDYTKTNNKITIICKLHGEFKQRSNHHLAGHGCPKCKADLKSKSNINFPIGWTHTNWQKAAERSNHFDSFKVYILKCIDIKTKEKFFKIGKTFTGLQRRFQGKTGMPYKYEVIKIHTFLSAKECSQFEEQLKRLNKENKYLPQKHFNGKHECFHTLN